MFNPSICPDRQQYQRLLAGCYPDADQLARLAEHLEQCPSCADTVHGMQGADTFVKRAASSSERPRGEEEAIERLAARLKLLGSPSASLPTLPPKIDEAEAEIARLLTPPQLEAEMGRLQRFRVLRVLGQGGMGIVLLAEDPQLPRLVALKIMRPSLAVSVQARRRFEAEARAMAAIEHDHIVPIWHVDEEQGVPFIVMPLLRGQSLETRLGRDGPLPSSEAIRVAREIALGLAAAHARGLIHRDIKPGNIWLEERDDGQPRSDVAGPPSAPRPRVKVLDFGLVRAAAGAGHTLGGTILGTPGYMAPEQIIGGQVTGQSDLFSLGCVLYRMTTGCEAFPGPNVWAILRATECEQPKPPHLVASSVSLPLSELIERLLAKNPVDRPASATVVIQALDARAPEAQPAPAAIAPTLTMPSSADAELPTARPRRRRWRLLAAGAAVAAALLTIYLTLSPAQRDRSDPPANAAKDSPSSLSLPSEASSLPGGERFRVESIAPRGRISALAFQPNTQTVATASEDGVLRLWDAKTGRLLRAIVPALPESSDLRQSSLAWKPDGKALAWGLPSGNVYEVDPDAGRVSVLHGNLGRVASLAWSADGKMFAVGVEESPNEIRVWREGELLPPCRDANVSSLAFSPDGKLLAAGGSQLWDVASGQLSPLSKGLPTLAKTLPATLAWSPDGAMLAIGGLLWTKANGKTRALESEGVAALQWLSEGKKIALAKNAGEVSVYDISAGKPDRRVNLQKLPAAIFGPTAFSFDGGLLAGNPSGDCDLKLWDAASGVAKWEFLGASSPVTWRVSPDGQRLLTVTGNALNLYATATGKLLQFVRFDGNRMLDGGFSPDGKWLAVGDWVRESNTLKEAHSVRGLWSAVWSPKSDRLAYILANQKGVHLLDLKSKQTRLVLSDLPVATGLAWSPDGEKLAAAHNTLGGAIYDVKRGTKLLSIETGSDVIRDVIWSGDGKRLAVRGDFRAWICDAATGKLVNVLAEKDKFAMSMAFSPDSKRLAAVRSDGQVNVWDTQEWKERRLASVPVGAFIVGPFWVDDGKTLLLSAGTAAIHSFDVANGRRRGVLWPMENARLLMVGSSGHYRGTANIRDHIVYVVQTATGQQTLTPDEFDKTFPWKNDPDQVRLWAK